MAQYGNGYVTIPFDSTKFDVFDETITHLNGNELMPASKMAQLCIDTANKPKKLIEKDTGVFVDLLVDTYGLSNNPKQISLTSIAYSSEYIVKKEIHLSYIPSEDDKTIFEWAYTDAEGKRSDYADVFIFHGTRVQ